MSGMRNHWLRPSGRAQMRWLALLLAGALLLTGTSRHMTYSHRERLTPTDPDRRLSGMDTFALGLVLGGMRGPLVMYLWPSTEEQKQENDLEDINTKIELIRMLQPEFDSVHLFQMWNLAYNLSVKMAGYPNKYSVILSALDYGREVDKERSHNVNILAQMGDIYFNKLGGAAEKRYYGDRMRRESMPRPAGQAAPQRDAGLQRTSHEPVLVRDANGRMVIDPKLLVARRAFRSTDTGEEYTGAEYQFLEQFCTPEMGGFPYGVPPQAIGYNYFERARLLMHATSQRHIHFGESVMDARPAVTLRMWGDDEMERARRLEGALFGKKLTDDKWDDRVELERVTGDIAVGTSVAPGPFENRTMLRGTDPRPRSAAEVLDEALFTYQRSRQLAKMAMAAYDRHIRNERFGGAMAGTGLQSTLDALEASEVTLEADRAYLELLGNAGKLRPLAAEKESQLRQAALKAYQRVIDAHYRLMLKYYVAPEVAAASYPTINGQKIDRTTVGGVDPKLLPEIFQATRAHIQQKLGGGDAHAADIYEYMTRINRAKVRMDSLNAGAR